jgi:gamma-glutamyltranspeptidase/glutathione hydrolase
MELDWSLPYAVHRRPTLAANVVATSQPLAAQAGLQAMQEGGNAVDAAVAAAITLTIVEPVSNGIGSDAFAMVWDGAHLHGLNASGRAPAAWTPEHFARSNGIPERGWNSVTVPGCVSAWHALSQRFGRLPFGELFSFAIRYAHDGYPVSPTVARQWAQQVPLLRHQPGFAQAFMPEGRAPQPGEIFRLPAAADTLERIAAKGPEAFYKGALADRLVAHAHACGGALDFTDLAAHACDWVEPVAQRYRDFELHELPPNGQGLIALVALGVLAHFDLAALPVDGPDSVHLQIEAVKLAMADAARYLCDADHMELPVAALLDPAYLATRAQLIDRERAQDFGHGTPPRGGTVYLTAADAEGRMVSYIQSNYMGFGSGVVVPDTGISLQNRGHAFTLAAGHPNRVAPRKRPFHTIIPGFVTRGGAPFATLGLMGGTMQAQGHTQVMVRIADYGQNPQAAIDAPRFRIVDGLEVNVEPHFPPATLVELERRGHRLKPLGEGYMDFGSAQIAMRLPGAYLAAWDARRDSLAVGF